MLGKFGKFTLVERIAEGGMAEVFKATVRGPEGFERIVAIKRLHRALCEDADLTQMLVDEARIAVQLNHPNIANVFDLGCIENQYFIIMEYIDGTDMLHLLDECRSHRSPMSIPGALFAVTETLSGLHYAHTKFGRNGEPLGIVHRDVSPQNIMVTWDGRVKLVDFGIAKARNRAQTTQHGIIKGKFYYMAPEQAHGHHVDSRTDVYAAGMVLYEALAGRSPYDDVPETELLRYVRRADFPPPIHFRRDLDPELSALVEIATQRNPEKRFANAMEFQLALNDYRHRKLGAFAEPHMARVVAQIANASRSNDNFEPLDRGGYRPSEESLIFEKPDDAALAAAGGGRISQNGNKNPFADDQPTEIYNGQSRQRDLPPSPGARQSPVSGSNTHADLPTHRNPSQQPFGAQPPPVTPQQRAQPSTKESFVDRMAKPKYIYLAIGIAALLVVALSVVLFMAKRGDDKPESVAVNTTTTTATTIAETIATPPEPSEVEVGVNSVPDNAQVIVDGSDRGTTPVTLKLEAGQTYNIEFVKEGFRLEEREYVAEVPVEDLTVELAEAKGIISLASFPSEATIEVDGQAQGVTPMYLTGLETSEEYTIVARLGDQEEKRTVRWDDPNQLVQDEMFEFKKAGKGSGVAVNVDDIPDTRPRKSSTKRRRYRRKPSRPKKPASSSSSTEDDDLNVFGSSSSSSSSKPDPKPEPSSDAKDEDLDIWGGSSTKKKKKKPAPKKPAPKEEDEDLDIW